MQWGAASRLQRFWDARAACNFIGGGAGSGLLLWAAVGMPIGLPYLPAAMIGLAFVAAGLFMVWLETGKRWRAFNLFFRPQTSWMTREGIVALPLFAAGAVAILFAADSRFGLELPSPVIPGTITAVLSLVFLYCQLRIMHSAKGLPAWRETWIMPLLGVSGLLEGLGIYLLLIAIIGIVSMYLQIAITAIMIARILVWYAYLAAIRRSGAPDSTTSALQAISSAFVTFGHVFPIALLILAWFVPEVAAPLAALAGITATLGGWYLKLNLVTKAAYIPEFTVPVAPVRGQAG